MDYLFESRSDVNHEMRNNIHVFVIILKTNFSTFDNYGRSELNLDTPYKSYCSLWSVAIVRRER